MHSTDRRYDRSMLAWIPTVIAIIAGVGLGLAGGGALSNVMLWQPRHWWTAAAGIVLNLLIRVTGLSGSLAVVVDLIASGLLVWFAIVNIRTAGMVVIVAGLALNAVPTLLNWGTPVSRSAVVTAGLVTGSIDQTTLDGPRHLENGDWFGFLGETIAVPTGQVWSVGDIVLHLGYVLTIAAILRRRRIPGASGDGIPYREAIRSLGDGPAPRRGPATHPSKFTPPPPTKDDYGTKAVRRLPPE